MRKISIAWIVLCIATLLHTRVFAEAEGVLSVKTDPDGIEVWLDDKYIGDSPIIDKKLKSGRYSLKLVDPVQHSSSTEEVFIQPGEQTMVEKTMKSRFGSLKVNTNPEGSEVSILTSLGKTPLSNDFIIPGKYRLEIRNPNGYKPLSTDVVVPKGEVLSIQKSLEKTGGLDGRGVARLALGLGAIAGTVLSMVEIGDDNFKNATDGSRTGCIVGGTLSILCVISFEIVAFF